MRTEHFKQKRALNLRASNTALHREGQWGEGGCKKGGRAEGWRDSWLIGIHNQTQLQLQVRRWIFVWVLFHARKQLGFGARHRGLRFCEWCSEEEVDLRGLTEVDCTLNLNATCTQRKQVIEKILSVCSFLNIRTKTRLRWNELFWSYCHLVLFQGFLARKSCSKFCKILF